MQDVDHGLMPHKSIPLKTRHNEIAPNQFKLPPLYQEENLAIDLNLGIMEFLRKITNKRALLTEKPFADINSSDNI
jgi:glutamine synthetase